MTQSFKICPICNTSNHPNATVCMNCGTTLNDVGTARTQANRTNTVTDFDFRYGETDLLESNLSRLGRRYTAGIIGILIGLMIAGGIFAFAPTALDSFSNIEMPGSAVENTVPTPRPTMFLATITPANPTNTPTITPPPTATATVTPTEAPCIRQVTANDTLYGLAVSCGHQGFDILPIIVATNNLPDQNSVSIGQEIIIPWPTEAAPPAPPEGAPSDDTSGASAPADGETLTIADDTTVSGPTPTPGLRPGLQYHLVQSGETMIAIASQYGLDFNTLQDLNPNILFSQCDFGQRFGGESCVISLSIGQPVVVPAPLPTATLSPTPSGSETPTPSPTATFNAPSALTPRDRSFFARNDLITLRWVTSGTLGLAETYQVTVEDLTAGVIYIATTDELSFVLPSEWQGTEEVRHEYRWYISIIDANDPDNPAFVTEALTFTWEGRGED